MNIFKVIDVEQTSRYYELTMQVVPEEKAQTLNCKFTIFIPKSNEYLCGFVKAYNEDIETNLELHMVGTISVAFHMSKGFFHFIMPCGTLLPMSVEK